jgi:hypothetical protein
MPIADGVLTITPEDIKITDHLWDSFGQHETEVSAEWLVKFAQARGKGWTPFTYSEIEAFYSKSGRLRGFTFNRLISGRFIHEIPAGVVGNETNDSVYHYTEDFIARCYKSASKKSV